MINYIFGSVEICAGDINAVSLLAKNNIRCSRIKNENSNVYISIPLYSLKKASLLLKESNIEFNILRILGLPNSFIKLRFRYGLILGMLIFIVVVYFGGRYIWSFQITGNSYVSDELILKTLNDLGCGVGTRIDDVNFDTLHNNFLIQCQDISWISVNMDGVIANVEVKEVKRAATENYDKANIVAGENGQIELITLISGRPQVEIGDVVKEGDLLISGVESYREGENTFYRNADGQVLARVNRIIRAQVNDYKKVRIKTGNFQERKRIKMFNLNVNLFRKCRNSYDEYDIIAENRQLILFGVIELPVWINSERIYEVYDETLKLSEKELEAEAIKVYNSLLKDATKDCQLVSISTNRNFENGVYTIESNIYCITDIAERLIYEMIPDVQKED